MGDISWRGGGALEIGSEASAANGSIATNLHVGPHGAGLDLFFETCGARICGIEPSPGQPDLMLRDLITEINGFPLNGPAQTVEEIFAKHFCDGVRITLQRAHD